MLKKTTQAKYVKYVESGGTYKPTLTQRGPQNSTYFTFTFLFLQGNVKDVQSLFWLHRKIIVNVKYVESVWTHLDIKESGKFLQIQHIEHI